MFTMWKTVFKIVRSQTPWIISWRRAVFPMWYMLREIHPAHELAAPWKETLWRKAFRLRAMRQSIYTRLSLGASPQSSFWSTAFSMFILYEGIQKSRQLEKAWKAALNLNRGNYFATQKGKRVDGIPTWREAIYPQRWEPARKLKDVW